MLQILCLSRTHLAGLIMFTILTAFMSTPVFSAETTVDSLLETHEGNKRPVLIFGSDIDDKAVAQISALWSNRTALEERDMLIVRVQAKQVVVQRTGRSLDGRNRDVETITDAALAEAFRERFEVPSDDFAVILIGKDGEVKRRSDIVLDADDIFRQIDSMPMRQNEMGRSKAGPSE